MNDKLTQLLEQLAAKLGTTAEYLWKVLLMQARVSATQSLLYVLFVAISGLVLYRCHRKFSKPFAETVDKYYENMYDKNEYTAVAMGVCSVVWIVLFIASLFSFPNLIDGYFNPEYWALKEILDSL